MFSKTMLVAMIDTPGVSKENHLNPNSLVTFKHSAAKSASKLFVASKRYIRSKMEKSKVQKIHNKTKLD